MGKKRNKEIIKRNAYLGTFSQINNLLDAVKKVNDFVPKQTECPSGNN